MPEPGREAGVTFTGDPQGSESSAKGACSEAQDGWTEGARRPGHVGGPRPWTVIHWGTKTNAHTLPSSAISSRKIIVFIQLVILTPSAIRVFLGDQKQTREGT